MAREPDGAGARYSIREPVAVAHPVMVGPPFAGTNTTDAEGVSKVLGSAPISIFWVIVWVFTSLPFEVMKAVETALYVW
jgi:hypothetical protein